MNGMGIREIHMHLNQTQGIYRLVIYHARESPTSTLGNSIAISTVKGTIMRLEIRISRKEMSTELDWSTVPNPKLR